VIGLCALIAGGAAIYFTRPGTVTQSAKPNVLLISIDSLRADRLGCHGNPHKPSPNIDAIAEVGVRFERCIAAAPWTLASHASLLTGLFTHEHGVNEKLEALDAATPLLPTLFASNGYATAAIVSGPFMSKPYGFDRGFDYYDDDIARMDEKQSHEAETSPRLAGKATQWLKRRVSEHREQPFFLFLHMWDVHYHYHPPPPYDTKYDPDYRGKANGTFRPWHSDFGERLKPRDIQHIRALYDGELAFTDEHVGQVLNVVKELGVADNTIVCITGDHGDEFYEHGFGGHLRTLYNEVLHVPWIVAGPGVPKGRVVEGGVANADILPTLTQLAGLSGGSTSLSGRSQTAVMSGTSQVVPRPIFGETMYQWMKPASSQPGNEGQLVCVELDGWKFIQRRSSPQFERLFNLRTDPAETKTLVRDEPSRAAQLRELLDAHFNSAERFQPGIMKDKDVRDRVTQTGYLTGGESDGAASRPVSEQPDGRTSGAGNGAKSPRGRGARGSNRAPTTRQAAP